MFNPQSTSLVLALGTMLFTPSMQAEEGVPETLVVDFERKTSGFDAYCELKPGAVRYEFEITRVVGDKGTVNSSGVLKDPLAAIENGIVSEDAKLSISVTDLKYCPWCHPEEMPMPLDWPPISAEVKVNGCPVGVLTSIPSWTGIMLPQKYLVPIECLRFPERVVDGEPIPRINELEINTDMVLLGTMSNGEPRCGVEVREVDLQSLSLEFDALAPVVLVHGNRDTPEFFERVHTADTGKFTKPFQEKHIPYAAVTFVSDVGPENLHGAELLTSVTAIAKEFGAHHVHIVAHSKGGLDSRAFLAQLGGSLSEPRIGVYSLTTLSTPHLGSAGADYSFAVRSHPWLSLIQLGLTEAVMGAFAYNEGHDNLTVQSVQTFNRRNLPNLPIQFNIDGRKNSVGYWAISADANKNDSHDSSGNPTIDEQEAAGSGHSASTVEKVYRILGAVRQVQVDESGWVTRIMVWPTESFQLNDFLVTTDSARLGSLEPNLVPYRRFVEWISKKKNHETIGDDEIGESAIQAIRTSQPMRWFQ